MKIARQAIKIPEVIQLGNYLYKSVECVANKRGLKDDAEIENK